MSGHLKPSCSSTVNAANVGVVLDPGEQVKLLCRALIGLAIGIIAST